MRYMRRGNHRLLAMVATFLLAGCGGRSPKDRDEPKGFPEPRGGQSGIVRAPNLIRVRNDLEQIGLAYVQYDQAHNKGPANFNDLAPYLDRDPHLKKRLDDGYFIFHWNLGTRQMTDGASNTILAYEKDPDKDGDRAVLMGNGKTRVLGDAQFKQMLKAQGK